MTQTISNTKLKKKFRELANRMPKVYVNGTEVNHYVEILAAYKKGGQQSVLNYCSPFMLQGAVETLEKENASVWKRRPGS